MAGDLLERYRTKRNPDRTPEPFGRPAGSAAGTLSTGGVFVVQQHAARRLHWDLRLEINGVLASWAVPRGPSADPKERRLAVRTEDHPLEYTGFEGIIPAGNYGAGAMIVWDRGTYRTADGEAAATSLTRGKLDLEMSGHKLRGRWALVRTKGEAGKNWLLIRKGVVPTAGRDLVVAQPASVLSGLTVEEVKQGIRRTDDLARRAQAAGAVRRPIDFATARPMLAETVPRPFSRAGWIFELKYDGVRVLAARFADGTVRLAYRTGRDATALFPEITDAVAHLPCDDFIIDGEIVALDERGVSSFERLQQRLGQTGTAAIRRATVETPVVMFCFDALAVAGYDLRGVRLDARKELVRRLVPETGSIRFADHFEGDGEVLFAEVSRLGFEGIVAKRSASVYHSGQRSRDWVKIKALRSADLAIVGYTHGKGARRTLGALMLAARRDGELVYAGNVGTGFDAAMIATLLQRLQPTQRPTAAFKGIPPGPAHTHVYVEPQLVAEIRYAEVTSAGLLRQPVFVRLRDDKTVGECDALQTRAVADDRVQRPVADSHNTGPQSPPASSPLRPTNLDKVFWPDEGYTKGHLLDYYERAWPWLAPYLRDRPVVLTRYPDGITGKSFFQKNAPAFTPDWVETFHIDDTDYFICNELDTLLYVINSGCIPLHVWSSRRGALERPDWSILDLDPKGAPFRHVIALAQRFHQLLDELDVPNFVKTSGQDGLHILVPLGATLTHAQARTFAELLARIVAAEQPALATVARPLGARGGKVYLDFLQNGFGKTIVAPFSVRPRTGAPVSTPLRWSAVRAGLDPARLTIRTVLKRFRRMEDPMRPVLQKTANVHAALAALSKRFR